MDPNVLVSGAISAKGAPREILHRWLDGEFEMVVSTDLLYELETVLLRDWFRRKLIVSEVLRYVMLLSDRATVLPQPEGSSIESIPDPDDHYLAHLAEAASVDHLVSGDGDLPAATSPRAFVELLKDPRR
ncbi:MAG: putative toxin-antitoxin system toxin component, PIN family [Actinomycetota bacterium]|nr:putative toxin-antitoxin system toxin component, PIN family [Rubrobacter sp.]MDQ3508207.1 putative toxin-antitoxin system toxin component, PIN family [Actinomycetota bacterium]